MSNTIRVGIVGYGNLGKGAEIAISQNPDMTLVAIFTRRDPKAIETVGADAAVVPFNKIEDYQETIDVLLLCGGSANDLPDMSPALVEKFNIVDSYDNHALILDHIERVDKPAKENNKTGIVTAGWDPGLFSMHRLLGEIVLPGGATQTFWGEGLSQGHSDAVRRVKGVKDAVQYTVPDPDMLDDARKGKGADLTAAERHKRICYVVAENEREKERIEREIKSMPHYFADYDTTVHFISEDELKENHSKMKHGGYVIRSGSTADNHLHKVEFSLALDSNPEFTASVLVAYARAAHRMNQDGLTGAKTIFDVPLSYLSPRPMDDVIRDLL